MTLESILSGVIWIAAAYALVGLGFGIWYLKFQASRVSETAAQGNLPFRLAVLPAFAALWPLVWFGKHFLGGVERPFSQRRIRRWHGIAVLLWVVLIPPIAFIALANRPVPVLETGTQSLPTEPNR